MMAVEQISLKDFRRTVRLSEMSTVTNEHESKREPRKDMRLDVRIPGKVTPNSCYMTICQLIKFILFERRQLPMPYDEMVLYQEKKTSTQSQRAVLRRKADLNWQRFERTLWQLDMVLANLKTLFCLSHVPRVLIMLGATTARPSQFCEINMEALELGDAVQGLDTSRYLSPIYRAFSVADLLYEVKTWPPRLMSTTVMALGHRNCGVEWFEPKVDFQVPVGVKKRVISLANDSEKLQSRNLEDYIWFQAPVSIKGLR